MAIIAAPMELNARRPIDVREVVKTLADRDALAYPYEGLEVWVQEEEKKYRCIKINGNSVTWVELGTSPGEVVISNSLQVEALPTENQDEYEIVFSHQD